MRHGPLNSAAELFMLAIAGKTNLYTRVVTEAVQVYQPLSSRAEDATGQSPSLSATERHPRNDSACRCRVGNIEVGSVMVGGREQRQRAARKEALRGN